MEKVDCSFLTELFDSLENAIILADTSGCVFLRNRLAVKLLGDVTHISQAWGRLELGPADDGQFKRNSREAMCNSPFGAHPVRLQVLDLAGSGAMAMVITPAADLEGPNRSDLPSASAELTIAKAAHELNNPLDGIGRFLSLAGKSLENGDSESASKFIKRAAGGMDHLKSTLSRMLRENSTDDSGHDSDLLEVVIQQSIDAVSSLLESAHAALICDMQYPDGAMIDCGVFGILCNLIKNACQAASTRITLKCRCDSSAAIISVTDNGRGIDPKDSDKIFESFYTTKADGHGLGLAVSKSQAQSMGGNLTYSDNPAGGAVFTLEVPLSRPLKRRLSGSSSKAGREINE